MILVFHDIDFLCIFVEVNGFATLKLAAGLVLFIFMDPLCGVLFGVNLNYFTLLIGVSGAMHQACTFSSIWRITQMDFIFCLAFASAALLRVGR